MTNLNLKTIKKSDKMSGITYRFLGERILYAREQLRKHKKNTKMYHYFMGKINGLFEIVDKKRRKK